MAYEEHSQFPAPPDDTIIWRYMDIPKLLSLLEQKALYFAVLNEMPDVWEGVLPSSFLTAIANQTSPGQVQRILKAGDN